MKAENKIELCLLPDRSGRRILRGRPRFLFLLIILLSVFIFSCCSEPKEPLELKVVTFNVRFDNPADGRQAWEFRRQAAGQLLRSLETDLIGTQEVLKNQLDDFLERLPGYGYLGVGRADGRTAGEYSAIFYRKDRLQAVKSGNFWLSQTPEVPGSRGWDAACERIVTWAIFREKNGDLELAFFNTHFDHVGQTARREGALMLINKIQDLAGNLPVILGGDFNAPADSEPIRIILDGGFLFNSRTLADEVVGPDWSFHGFGRVPEEKRQLIDFIFVSHQFEVLEYRNIFEQVNGTYHSDHNPILVKLRVNRR
ncbi:MAG: endonuclease/exonuclease/phosphatase family protein [Candidatus Saccharicenans sp.]|nr:endonuclease/exonuclease/phosphatase family protein [Candidatus Saccharicenans sp.]